MLLKRTVDEREEAFRGWIQSLELEMVRTKDDPSADQVSHVDHGSANHESDHIRQSSFQSQDQNIVSVKESKVPEIKMTKL